MREAKPELLVGLNNLLSNIKTNTGRRKKTAASELGILLNLTNNFYDLKNTDLTSPSPLSESNLDLDEVFSKVINEVADEVFNDVINMLMEKLVFLVVELIIVVWKEAAVKLGGVEGDNPVLISDLTK